LDDIWSDYAFWSAQYLGNYFLNFQAISFFGSRYGTVVGLGGTILHTSTGGIVSEVANDRRQIPFTFQLFQNYPNPFNPTTTIQYFLSKAGQVSLDVYNVLGERVLVLVDETQTPGAKAVTFDASRLSSGTYFYQLRTGGRIETRKCLLIR
jgi:hypothetical protein